MPEPLTPGDGQDLFASFKRAREKRDPDRMMELFAADAEYRLDPFEPPLRGVNEIRGYWNRIAAEQTHIDFDAERVWVVGRSILASWHAAHTMESTADRIRVRGFSTAEIDDAGLVTRLREWPVSRLIGTDSKHYPDDVEQGVGEEQDG